MWAVRTVRERRNSKMDVILLNTISTTLQLRYSNSVPIPTPERSAAFHQTVQGHHIAANQKAYRKVEFFPP